MTMTRWARRIALAAGLAATLTPAAHAQGVDKFYKDNTLAFNVNAATCGVGDCFACPFSPFDSEHFSVQPETLVVNEHGASGTKAALLMQKLGPSDGSTIWRLRG